MSNNTLVKLNFKKFKFKNAVDNCYHVYQDDQNFTEIFASDASEAIKKSNIAIPYKIMHYDMKAKNYFSQEDLQEVDVIQNTEQQEKIQNITNNISMTENKSIDLTAAMIVEDKD